MTPEGYEPPGFQAADVEGFHFEDEPMNIKVGDVSTVSIEYKTGDKKLCLGLFILCTSEVAIVNVLNFWHLFIKNLASFNFFLPMHSCIPQEILGKHLTGGKNPGHPDLWLLSYFLMIRM